MADVELLPLPMILRHPSDKDLADHVQTYARACVAHATAAKDAEIEALRAQLDEQCRLHAIGMERELALIAERDRLRVEVERLRAIAGCAYQMAGVHDAPEVWLDRLGQAANGDALPDPYTISDELLPYQPDAVCEAEARAERLAEEVEALRAEVATWEGLHASEVQVRQRWQARAERLAEALRAERRWWVDRKADAIREQVGGLTRGDPGAIARCDAAIQRIDAALRDQGEG